MPPMIMHGGRLAPRMSGASRVHTPTADKGTARMRLAVMKETFLLPRLIKGQAQRQPRRKNGGGPSADETASAPTSVCFQLGERGKAPRLSYPEQSVAPPPSATPTPFIISSCATETLCVLHSFRPPLLFLLCCCTFIKNARGAYLHCKAAFRPSHTHVTSRLVVWTRANSVCL